MNTKTFGDQAKELAKQAWTLAAVLFYMALSAVAFLLLLVWFGSLSAAIGTFLYGALFVGACVCDYVDREEERVRYSREKRRGTDVPALYAFGSAVFVIMLTCRDVQSSDFYSAGGLYFMLCIGVCIGIYIGEAVARPKA